MFAVAMKPKSTQQRLPKFHRAPTQVREREITDRSLAIIETIERYRLLPTSLLVRLAPGNEDVTHRHLQYLFHRGLISRFSFPRFGLPGEFHYYLDNPEALQLLVEHLRVPAERLDFEGVRRNREKRYADIHDRTKSEETLGRMLFLKHETMVSRFHAMLELACRSSDGKVELAAWRQGPDLWSSVETPASAAFRDETERLPHRPDAFFTLRFPGAPEGQNRANFFYEADRKTTSTRKFRRKLRAYFHFVVKQHKHEQIYGIRRVRAVLIETTDIRWAEELRQAARHPSVSGDTPTPLFWFTASELFTKGQEVPNGGRIQKLPRFLIQPDLIFKPVWVSPVDDTLHSLLN